VHIDPGCVKKGRKGYAHLLRKGVKRGKRAERPAGSAAIKGKHARLEWSLKEGEGERVGGWLLT